MMQLEVQKRLNSATGTMLLDVKLQLERGQVIGLYGKSGAGKTSLLRIIAGLFDPDQAHIVFGTQTWINTQQRVDLRPQERKIGFVFQDYALFPNMTVRENLEFALKKGQDKAVVDELILINELGQLQGQKPATLSGGQQQRVALARSLVQRPQLLLLDEPLSAVDQEMRLKLRKHLLHLHRRFALTTILISHDQQELEQMADQVIILDAGQVIKTGKPREVFTSSKDSDSLSVYGRIIAIEQSENGSWIELRTEQQRLKVWVAPEQGSRLITGQTIGVRAVAGGWEVQWL